eukprot:jgi/Chlat1/8236/Chrsp77S00623
MRASLSLKSAPSISISRPQLRPRHKHATPMGQTQQTHRQVVCAAAAVSSSVKFSVAKPVKFGETVVVVGDHASLGQWDPRRGAAMTWNDGHVWVAHVDLPPGEQLHFKYAVRGGDGSVRWLDGDNLALTVPQENGEAPAYVPPTKQEAAPATTTTTSSKQGSSQTDIVSFFFFFFFGRPSRVVQQRGLPNDGTGPVTNRLGVMEQWYGHLEKLGVTAVYFGPLFESGTHGYDTADYYAIDRRLGTVDDFKQVVSSLHARGIRVILDGVFNHTGTRFFAFNDIIHNGPSQSQYRDWYFVDSSKQGGDIADGRGYQSWEGHTSLPRLNVANPEVRRYLFDVARYWLKEVGDYNRWIGPDRLDSGTNYQLSKAIWSSVNDMNYFELLKDQRHYNLAVLFLLTTRGIPCLYYGDEVGMEGSPGGPEGDLAMRKPLEFTHTDINDGKYAFTEKAVKLKTANPAFSGSVDIIPLINTNKQVAYMRAGGGQTAIVVMNCGFEAEERFNVDVKGKIPDGVEMTDVLNEGEGKGGVFAVKGGKIEMPLEACGARVLVDKRFE